MEERGDVPGMPGYQFLSRRMIKFMALMNFPRYINTESRDFFYLTLRHVLPGDAITPVITPSDPGEGTWRVRVVVENAGWMPTNVTQQALDRGVVQPLVARISVPDGLVVGGRERIELGQLTGRALQNSAIHQFGSSDDTTDRAVAEWIVQARAGASVEVEIRHDRAGVVEQLITLG